MADPKVNAPPSQTPAAHPFQRTLDGLDGNLDLLHKLAPSIAEHYAAHAQELRDHARGGDLAGLQWLAHKLGGTWRLYSTGGKAGLDLPERLGAAAGAGDRVLATALALELAQQMDAMVTDLRALTGNT